MGTVASVGNSNTSRHDGLTVQQRTAASLLARGRDRQAVAQVVGVAPGTLSAWRRIPAFKAAEAEEAARSTTVRGIVTDAMLSARKDDGVDWANRLRAEAMLDELDARGDARQDVPLGMIVVPLEPVFGP
jgi:hypothetical protein